MHNEPVHSPFHDPSRRRIAAAGILRPYRGIAADKAVTIGIDLSLTGADAETAVRIRDGFMLAIDEANAKGGAAGYHLNVLLLDDGTATAGQYDPAQGATNVRKMVADRRSSPRSAR